MKYESASGVLLGWRYWNVCRNQLISPYRGCIWNNHTMSVDSLEEDRGLYAYNSFDLLDPIEIIQPVVGLVAASGEIQLHEAGFRAKNMQIIALAPGKRFNSKFFAMYNKAMNITLDYNLRSDLDLEGKEEVGFYEDVFSLINFGIDLAGQKEFMLPKFDQQKSKKPKLMYKEQLGKDIL